MEHVYLSGAEDVRSAGNTIRDAAASMERSAASFDETMLRAMRHFEELVCRFETAVAESKTK